MHQGAIARILNNPLGIEFVQFFHFYFIYIDDEFLDLIVFIEKFFFDEILTSIFAKIIFFTIKCKIWSLIQTKIYIQYLNLFKNNPRIN